MIGGKNKMKIENLKIVSLGKNSFYLNVGVLIRSGQVDASKLYNVEITEAAQPILSIPQ